MPKKQENQNKGEESPILKPNAKVCCHYLPRLKAFLFAYK